MRMDLCSLLAIGLTSPSTFSFCFFILFPPTGEVVWIGWGRMLEHLIPIRTHVEEYVGLAAICSRSRPSEGLVSLLLSSTMTGNERDVCCVVV